MPGIAEKQDIPSYFNAQEYRIIAGILLWFIFVIVTSGLYLAFGINLRTSLVALVIIFFSGWRLFKRKKDAETQKIPWLPETSFCKILVLFAFISDLYLIIYTFSTRTDAAMQTVLTQLNPAFFVLFGLSSIALTLVFFFNKTPHRSLNLLFPVHFFVFFGINWLGFRFGYGYDPIIHQTAEKYIDAFGKILPVQPFYIGQYAPFVAIHKLTMIPLDFIDRFFLPFATAVILPLTAKIGFSRGWKLNERAANFATLFLLLIPIAALTFTVPYNLTVLYLLLILLLFPLFQKRLVKTLFVCIALASIFTHPMLGAPIALFVAYLFADELPIGRNIKTSLKLAAIALCAVSIPLMFAAYRYLHGESPFVRLDFWNNLNGFKDLWRFPYDLTAGPLHLKIFYWYEQIIFYAGILFGFVILFLKNYFPAKHRNLILGFFGALFVSIFFTSVMISIPDVAIYEQMEFVLRLKIILPVILLPAISYFLARLIDEKEKSAKTLIPALIFVSVLSLHLTYPQTNEIAVYSGWNAGADDYRGAEMLLKDAGSELYIVIANQVFAAALQKDIGFDKAFELNGQKISPLPLDMNGPVAPLSDELLYTELTPELLGRIKRTFPDFNIYVAVPHYWFNFDQLITAAEKMDAKIVFTTDRITIVRF
jgi:hypothetical protein